MRSTHTTVPLYGRTAREAAPSRQDSVAARYPAWVRLLAMAAFTLAFLGWLNESWLFLWDSPIWLNRYTEYAIILGFGLWRIRETAGFAYRDRTLRGPWIWRLRHVKWLFFTWYMGVMVATQFPPSGWTVTLVGLGLAGVEQALDWLAAVNAGSARQLAGRNVLVLGGGDTAMDCARSARRLGARVRVAYRGPEGCLRAAAKEVALTREEGVEFLFDHPPQAFIGSDHLESVQFTGGATLPADLAVLAFGQQPDPPPWLAGLEVELESDGGIRVDGNGRTSHPKIYAGGDNTHGPGLAVTAMAAGRRAAEGILVDTARRLPVARLTWGRRNLPAEQSLDYLGPVDTACPGKAAAGRPAGEAG